MTTLYVSTTLQALAERYSRFRLEVQTANDSGEAGSYADCARRVLQRESRTAKAAFGAPLSRTAASSSPAGELVWIPLNKSVDRSTAARVAHHQGGLGRTFVPHGHQQQSSR